MFNDGGYYMGGMHGIWWLFWIALIGVVVFYGWGRPNEQRRRLGETPLDTLQRRLASGEITPEQYEEHKAVLDRET